MVDLSAGECTGGIRGTAHQHHHAGRGSSDSERGIRTFRSRRAVLSEFLTEVFSR